jgi:glycosyltransferase involved in cell wall biosynthesis
MSPEVRKLEIPLLVTTLLMGARVYQDYRGRSDTVAIEVDGEFTALAKADFDIVQQIAATIQNNLQIPRLVSLKQCIEITRMAALELVRIGDERTGKKGIVMLKDRTGSGYWRMVFPARYMDQSGIYVDITAAGVPFNSLLEYHTVYVQRIHDWESYYLLKRIKQAGKRIVYDLDDDIFNIDKENPAFRVIGRDEQMAAVACMKLADEVTVTTTQLQTVIRGVTEGIEATIIPNAIHPEDGWVPTPLTGSTDGIKRIFWQGGEAHSEDWRECIDAVDAVLHERADVRLVILGFLPPILYKYVKKPTWVGKVEFLEFKDPETYFQIMKFVRAEVGLAPLNDTPFNRSKSELKFVEYSAMGIPTVASDVKPYADVIDHGNSGFLVKSAEEWYNSMVTCLDDKRRRYSIIAKARQEIKESYDIREMAKVWKTVLVP